MVSRYATTKPLADLLSESNVDGWVKVAGHVASVTKLIPAKRTWGSRRLPVVGAANQLAAIPNAGVPGIES
jgi:hypothetical protein